MNSRGNQNVKNVMKMYNPDLKKAENPPVITQKDILKKMKEELEYLKNKLQINVEWMKKILHRQILEHLKQAHGIYEKSDADWYYQSVDIWAKQYCVFTWDKDRNAIPKYWCDTRETCENCTGLYQHYKDYLDPNDDERIKTIKAISEMKQKIKEQEINVRTEEQYDLENLNNLQNQNINQKVQKKK